MEAVMFDHPRRVKAVTVVMRSPMPWGFFGIKDVAAMVSLGQSMLISSSAAGEDLCLVADGDTVGVRGCLDAMADGSGVEIFSLNIASQLVSALTGQCITVTNGKLGMQSCEGAADAGDCRSTFVVEMASQVQSQSGYCLTASAAGASAVPCAADLGGGIAMVSTTDWDPATAMPVKDAAALLHAAAARQERLLGELKRSLQACRGLTSNRTLSRQEALAAEPPESEPGLFAAASRRIDGAAHVDLAAVKALISESKALLSTA